MTRYSKLTESLPGNPHRWLVTGAAGFIGSHLVETLLGLDQHVVGVDNFSAGRQLNLDHVKAAVGDERWNRFRFIEGSVTDAATCDDACREIDYVLHQAALGSVPQSIEDPLTTHDSNVTGMLQLLASAQKAKVQRVVYASSCSVYGDSPALPKVESGEIAPLSPYAATKWIDEIYAGVFARAYGLETIGLRYFNIFGPRQDPDGAYAAVIPKWATAILRGEPTRINGTGETSRDFCYVADTVQANLLAATTENEAAIDTVFNVALHSQTTLNELFNMIRDFLAASDPSLVIPDPEHAEFREGDIRHSLADIKRAKTLLGFEPEHSVKDGLENTVRWFCDATAMTA